jgi:sugar lactone lactonase YvrE
MSGKGLRRALAACALVAASLAAMPRGWCASYYTQKLNDAKAVYLTHEKFAVHADGVADDSDAIQKAIDQVQETTGQGIVFVPSGRYRITRTVFVWPGVRVIGYGATRPVLVLKDHTPGFGADLAYMVFFAGGRPGYLPDWMGRPAGKGSQGSPRPRMREAKPMPGTVPAGVPVIDANPGTFYSAMSNIDFEIGEGNPGAVGIRFHVAQHCYLSHMDFHVGSGMAALHDIGNEAEDLHFYGGRYGIMTRKPSPGWQFTLLDSIFEGQREAAIKEHEAGLVLVRDTFRKVPAAIAIDPGYSDELWVKQARFEDVSGPAITISNENNARTEINLVDSVCRHVPVLARFRESGKEVKGPAEQYQVKTFSHGLTIADLGAGAKIETRFDAEPLTTMPAAPEPAIRDLPARATWVNLRDLGAKGDGTTDDTAAIKKAIAEHQAIYVPSGRYLVSDTIRLKADTVLIGLHPSMTQFDLADSTPGFDGAGEAKALLETPPGGSNIVAGIGLYTGGVNSRAVAALWMAGKDSLMDDVRFLGGHGTNAADGSRINPYNNTHTADPDLKNRWDGQYPSLWVTKGGGGTFANIWTPDTFAQAGLYVSDTETEGHVYELSSEHHVRNEVKLNRVANWELFAIQTEEERGEGPFALPVEIDNSKNILFADYHSYRVVSSYQPFPCAIRIAHSEGIRFRNLHVYSDSKASFDSSVCVGNPAAEIRYREVGSLDLSGKHVSDAGMGREASGPKVEKLADGFFNISGGAVDAEGRLYFVDAHWQRIYRWSPETSDLDMIRDNPIDATNLAVDKAGDVMAVSYAGDGTVYSFRPDAPETQLTVLKPEPATARPGMRAVLPTDYWRNENDFVEAVPVRKPYQYVSPDGSVFLPAGEDFKSGALYYGTKMADVLRAFSMATATAGKPFYVTDESGEKTYSADVASDGTLTNVKLFAEQGGESVVSDADGKVYLAAGQIFVYRPDGKLERTIDVPQRPIDLVLGGKDGRTLFVLARSALYSVELPH